MSDGERLPWERQFGESRQAFKAFAFYRDMGDERGLRLAAERMERNRRLLDRWSSKWSWVSRVEAYEDYLDEIQRKVNEAAIIEAKEQHAALASDALAKSAERIAAMDASEIPVGVLPQFLKVASDLQLRSLGEITERSAHELSGPGGEPLPAMFTFAFDKPDEFGLEDDDDDDTGDPSEGRKPDTDSDPPPGGASTAQ